MESKIKIKSETAKSVESVPVIQENKKRNGYVIIGVIALVIIFGLIIYTAIIYNNASKTFCESKNMTFVEGDCCVLYKDINGMQCADIIKFKDSWYLKIK